MTDETLTDDERDALRSRIVCSICGERPAACVEYDLKDSVLNHCCDECCYHNGWRGPCVRHDLPRALDTIDHLEEENERLRAECDKWRTRANEINDAYEDLKAAALKHVDITDEQVEATEEVAKRMMEAVEERDELRATLDYAAMRIDNARAALDDGRSRDRVASLLRQAANEIEREEDTDE